MGYAVTIQPQLGVCDDLLSPVRLAGDMDVLRILGEVATAEGDSLMKGATYFNNPDTCVAIGLTVAGYMTFVYEGSGALPICHLTEAGRDLLGR